MQLIRRILLVALAAVAMAAAASGSAQSAGPAPAVLGGGSGIVFFRQQTICSLTAIGWDRARRLVGFTAAHCAPLGAELVAEAAQPRIAGRIVPIGRVMSRNQGMDYEVIQFDPTLVRPARSIGGTTIDGVGGFPGAGSTVCDNGRSTGRGCGVVWGRLPNGTWANQACAAEGDSGGPVTAGNLVVGMINAGIYQSGSASLPDCTSPANPVHAVQISTAMADILADLNAHPAAVGAGFRTY